MVSCGAFFHSLILSRSQRRQFHGTFFVRNRPELELIRTLANRMAKGSTVRLSVLACSCGAEVYSILWTIRSARPDLNVIVCASDISNEILETAKEGRYPLHGRELVGEPIFERLTNEEMEAIFDRDRNQVRVKGWIKEGVKWQVADAFDPELTAVLGGQDIVVANRFLCHMDPPDAERCLRNIARLVNPGGYLFVSGIDLDVRTKVATDLGWTPVPELLKEIHNGDPSLRRGWPWTWWGLEPLRAERPDWRVRYASVFQLGRKPPCTAAADES